MCLYIATVACFRFVFALDEAAGDAIIVESWESSMDPKYPDEEGNQFGELGDLNFCKHYH